MQEVFVPVLPEKARPTMKISKVDRFGLVTVAFSEELVLPPKEALSLIDEKVLDISVTPTNPALTPLLKFKWELVLF